MLKIKGIMISILGAALLTACGQKEEEATPQVVVAKEVTPVTEAFGQVVASEVHSVTIPFDCQIIRSYIMDGSEVTKGDLLLEVDLVPYLEALQLKEEELAALQAEIAILYPQEASPSLALKTQVETKRLDDLMRRQAELKMAIANETSQDLDLLKLKLSETHDQETRLNEALIQAQSLLDAGQISKEEFKAKETALETLIMSSQALELEYDIKIQSMQRDLEDLNYSISQLEAGLLDLNDQASTSDVTYIMKSLAIKTLDLEIKTLKDQLNKSGIKEDGGLYAPIDGVITAYSYLEGDYHQGNISNPILKIQGSKALVIECHLAEDFIKDVHVGSKASIRPVADRTQTFEAKVIFIAGYGEGTGSGTLVGVRLSLVEPNAFLKPGYSVDISIEGD